jgi:hypothetical protein
MGGIFVQEWFKILFFVARNRAIRLSLTAQDVGVTGIEDSHGGAAEELTASGTELNL